MSVAERRRTLLLAVATLIAIVVAMAGRLTAPCDLWDQTQDRTIAYTADMLTRGGEAWVLARDSEGLPATKPPLYNWCAAPFVALAGRSSDWAHKAPSMLAALAMVGLLVVAGERMRPSLGWLAALIWVACYPTYKLAYLARPDMVLSALLFAGFLAGAKLLAAPTPQRSTRLDAAIFWASCILAAWTKGPACLVLPAFAVLGSVAAHGTLEPLRRFHPLIGCVAFVLLAPAWYTAAAVLDPHHVVDRLWNAEVVGRVTGLGPEGGQRGPWAILRGLPYMPLYFLGRFAPWSILTLCGLLALLARDSEVTARWRRVLHGRFLLLACIWVGVLVMGFSLSSGKRADYIAPAYAPAALVAAWWLLEDRFSPLFSAGLWVAPTAALVALAATIVVDHRGPVYRPASTRQLDEARAALAALPRDRPTIVVVPQFPHLGVLCGDGPPQQQNAAVLGQLLRSGQPFRVLWSKPNAADPEVEPILYQLLEDGRACDRWSIVLTAELRSYGYFSPLRIIDVEAGESAHAAKRSPAS